MKLLDYGEIELLECSGSDASICEAARISYSNKKKTSNDETLIRYMMRHKHSSPFEVADMKFYVKAPIFVFRQWHRHRTWSFSEISFRYSGPKEEFYIPKEFREQSKTNKQGTGDKLIAYTIGSYDKSFTEYQAMINAGISREQARIVLPTATYSEMYAKCDLRNLLHFLALRLDKHAQWEIRQYAKFIAEKVKEKFPLTFAAFEDYVLSATSFSGTELNLLNVDVFNMSTGLGSPKDTGDLKIEIDYEKLLKLSKRERNEFLAKLKGISNERVLQAVRKRLKQQRSS